MNQQWRHLALGPSAHPLMLGIAMVYDWLIVWSGFDWKRNVIDKYPDYGQAILKPWGRNVEHLYDEAFSTKTASNWY